MIALASATGHARTLPASRTGAGEMMPCSMHFLMLSVLRGFAVRLRQRHAATSPGWEECPEQADVRVVALTAKTALVPVQPVFAESTFAREMEAKGRARATVIRRLCTVAGFYKYAVEEELLDHSPAAHVRRPRLDYESNATALDRNELGALLVAGLGPPAEQALISLLALAR